MREEVNKKTPNMFKNEMMPSSLAKHLLNYDYVMIDTCSLMEDSFPIWMDALEGARKNYINRPLPVYVLDSSVNELKKHKKDHKRADKRIAAIRALRIVRKTKWHKTITILKIGKNQNFADKQILAKVQEDKTDYKILVITQDKKLASDLIAINKQLSVKGRFIAIEKILPSGELAPNKGEELPPIPASKTPSGPKQSFSKGLTEQKGPSPHQTHRPDPSELNNKVVSADRRLRSTVGNPNYPLDKKIADCKALLSDLSRLSPETMASLHLFYTPEKLNELIESLSSPKPIESKEKAAPKAAKPADKPAKKKDLWYEYGKTVEEAFKAAATHYGIFFRDRKVAYVPSIHGPIDFAEDDLGKIVQLFGELNMGEKPIRTYKGINLMAERTPKGIKAWIDVNGVLNPQKAEAEPKKEEPLKEVKPAPKKKAPKPVEKPVEAPKEEPKPKEDTPLKKETPKAKKQPVKKAESQKEMKAEKPAKPSEKPAEAPQKKAESSSKKKEQAKPDKPSEKKPEPVKKAPAKKPAETPKKEAKPKAESEAKKESEPKPVKKAKAAPKPKKEEPKEEAPKKDEKPAKKKPTVLEEAIAFDERLKANIMNPQYSKEQKIKDIEAQMERIKKIPVAERNKLNYNLDSLKGMLSMVK